MAESTTSRHYIFIAVSFKIDVKIDTDDGWIGFKDPCPILF